MATKRAHWRRPKPAPAAPPIVDDPTKPIAEVLFGIRDADAVDHAVPPPLEAATSEPQPDIVQTQEETAMTTDAPKSGILAPAGGAGVQLATLPPELVGAFTPEEWADMSDADKAGALAFWREEQAETTDGLSVTFPRWKFPTSGATRFVLDQEGDDAPEEKELHGVVVAKLPGRGYYEPGKAASKGTPPLCASSDGVVPDVIPSPVSPQAKTCAACPFSQWGSGRDGQGNATRGQACKFRIRTFFLSGDKPIPEYISLPPTAQKPFAQYAVALRQMRIPIIAVETVFGLTKATSRDGTEYMGLTLKVGRKLTFVEMKHAREIASAFEQQMRQRGVTVEETDDADHVAGAEGQVLDAAGRPIPL